MIEGKAFVTQQSAPAEVLSRRDRMRAATTAEIKQTARRILVSRGPDAVSLRAIAREMGMTAPALYRYFGSREELIRNVIADIFTELAGDISAAIDQAGLTAAGDLAAKMIAACREFRRWSLNHQGEFGLIFGSPLPGVDDGRDDIADECGRKFAATFFTLFLELWLRSPFPVRAPEAIDPGLRGQLERFRDATGAGHPAGRHPDLPALLGEAVRGGQHGGLRAPRLRPGRRGTHVRDHPVRVGRRRWLAVRAGELMRTPAWPAA